MREFFSFFLVSEKLHPEYYTVNSVVDGLLYSQEFKSIHIDTFSAVASQFILLWYSVSIENSSNSVSLKMNFF